MTERPDPVAERVKPVAARGPSAPCSGEPVIVVRDGVFGYGGVPTVQADLRICRGEVVALLGPNGSGKTTLLKGVLGLVERLGGSVELFGQPAERFTDHHLLGYVPQRQTAAGPIPVTVTELVRSGRLGAGGTFRRWRRSDAAAVRKAIATVGLEAFARRPVATLSGGQQRRALVARALAGGADVLLLDEPFAGVDQHHQEALADTFAALVDAGATVLVVLHELGPLEPVIGRAVCLDTGRVRYDGPIEDAPPPLLHLGHDHDPHGGPGAPSGLGWTR